MHGRRGCIRTACVQRHGWACGGVAVAPFAFQAQLRRVLLQLLERGARLRAQGAQGALRLCKGRSLRLLQPTQLLARLALPLEQCLLRGGSSGLLAQDLGRPAAYLRRLLLQALQPAGGLSSRRMQ